MRGWRQAVLPAVDRLVDPLNLYAVYTLSEDEHVGDVVATGDDPVDQVRAWLLEEGHRPSRLSALKYHPETGQPDAGSFYRVDSVRDPRKQWHVHLWPSEHGDDLVEIFSHYEYRPHPWPVGGEGVGDLLARLHTHYRPVHGTENTEDVDYVRGAACPAVRDLVDG